MILMTFLNFEMKSLNLFITNIQHSTIEGTILIFLFLLLQIIVLCCLRTLDYSHLLAIPQQESQHFNNRQFSSGLFHLIYFFAGINPLLSGFHTHGFKTIPLCFIKVMTSMVKSGIIITTIIIFVQPTHFVSLDSILK